MTVEHDAAPSERPGVSTWPVVLTVAGILAMLIAIGFGFQFFFPDRIGITSVDRNAFPAPAVRTDERHQRLALEARQRAELAGADGRMSIEDAMRAIAARGNRAFDPIGGNP